MQMQVYCQIVTIHNDLNATVEATLRPGSPERWTLVPVSVLLPPKQSVDVQLRLRVLRFAQRRKAQEHGQRDVFHIKARRHEGGRVCRCLVCIAAVRAVVDAADSCIGFCRPHTLSRSSLPHSSWPPQKGLEPLVQHSKPCQVCSAQPALVRWERRAVYGIPAMSTRLHGQAAPQRLGLAPAMQLITDMRPLQHAVRKMRPHSQKQGICSMPWLLKLSAALATAFQSMTCQTRKAVSAARFGDHSMRHTVLQPHSVCVSWRSSWRRRQHGKPCCGTALLRVTTLSGVV